MIQQNPRDFRITTPHASLLDADSRAFIQDLCTHDGFRAWFSTQTALCARNPIISKILLDGDTTALQASSEPDSERLSKFGHDFLEAERMRGALMNEAEQAAIDKVFDEL